jgi:hypothetical protein
MRVGLSHGAVHRRRLAWRAASGFGGGPKLFQTSRSSLGICCRKKVGGPRLGSRAPKVASRMIRTWRGRIMGSSIQLPSQRQVVFDPNYSMNGPLPPHSPSNKDRVGTRPMPRNMQTRGQLEPACKNGFFIFFNSLREGLRGASVPGCTGSGKRSQSGTAHRVSRSRAMPHKPSLLAQHSCSKLVQRNTVDGGIVLRCSLPHNEKRPVKLK